jgi:Tfp pilus assembly protein PilX
MKAAKRNGPQPGVVGGVSPARAKRRGVALVIALLLLAVLTVLAGTGVRMSIGEVWMAGNEQFHLQAVDAASAGVETAVARISAAGSASPVPSGGLNQAVGSASEFTVSARRRAQESVLAGSSAGRIMGEHVEIESLGTSSRGARDSQVQGVMVISAANGLTRFSRIGAGLSEAVGP